MDFWRSGLTTRDIGPSSTEAITWLDSGLTCVHSFAPSRVEDTRRALVLALDQSFGRHRFSEPLPVGCFVREQVLSEREVVRIPDTQRTATKNDPASTSGRQSIRRPQGPDGVHARRFPHGYLTLPIGVIVVVNRTERPSRICAHITRKVPSGSEVIPK